MNQSNLAFPATPISDELILDSELSCNAFRVLCLIIKNDNPWTVSREFLSNNMPVGRDALNRAIQELERGAYLKRIRFRNKSNSWWSGTYWLFSQIPGIIDFEQAYQIIRDRGFIPEGGSL
jgi:hypothetical protein